MELGCRATVPGQPDLPGLAPGHRRIDRLCRTEIAENRLALCIEQHIVDSHIGVHKTSIVERGERSTESDPGLDRSIRIRTHRSRTHGIRTRALLRAGDFVVWRVRGDHQTMMQLQHEHRKTLACLCSGQQLQRMGVMGDEAENVCFALGPLLQPLPVLVVMEHLQGDRPSTGIHGPVHVGEPSDAQQREGVKS